MFLPDNLKDTNAEKEQEIARRKAYVSIEKWAIELIPEHIRTGVQISVQEVQCGDPNCAPIDTAVAVLFPAGGGRGMTGLPMEAKDVTKKDLIESFPTAEVLMKWHNGEEAIWPPLDDDEDEPDEADGVPKLRFGIGQAVECRIGPDPETGWARGEIIQLWYRESGWPPNSWAPYKVQLDSGKKLFAPADLDHVIRIARS